MTCEAEGKGFHTCRLGDSEEDGVEVHRRGVCGAVGRLRRRYRPTAAITSGSLVYWISSGTRSELMRAEAAEECPHAAHGLHPC